MAADTYFAERRPPAELAGYAGRFWVRRSAGPLPPDLPRAAVDLLAFPDGSLWLAGPETRARRGTLPAGGVLAGVRLRPGACRDLVGVAADEVPLEGAPLADLLGTRTARDLSDAAHAPYVPHPPCVPHAPYASQVPHGGPDRPLRTAVHALRLLAARRRPHSDRGLVPDRAVRRALRSMYLRPGGRTAAYAAEVGLTERQLRRRFGIEVGLRPKSCARVLRLHRVLSAARRSLERGAKVPWAALAADSGFYDQPHLLGEFRRSVGCTPAALLSSEGVVFSKTGRGGCGGWPYVPQHGGPQHGPQHDGPQHGRGDPRLP